MTTLTTLIYRTARYTRTETAPAARLPRELIYRGLRHDGLAAAIRPGVRAMTWRGVTYAKTSGGQIVPGAAGPAASGGLSAVMV